jgi:hypothetical protein
VIPALLVGSQPSWRRQIDAILFAHGIEVGWWWPTPSHLSDIPAGACIVIVATDNCSHKLSKPAMERARKAGTPLVCGPHRKAAMTPLLTKQGFPLLAVTEDNGPGTFGIDVTQAALATLPASTILDLPLLDADEDADLPVPVPTEPSMPPTAPPAAILPPAAFASLNADAIALYQRVLPIIAANPWITTAEVAARLSVASGSLFYPMRVARDALGIKAGVGAGASRIVDRTLYEHGCAVLDVTPIVGDIGPTRPPYTAKDRNGGDRGQPGRGVVPAPKASKVIAPITPPPPLPASLLPAPAPTPTPAPAPSDDLRDTKEALRLLLEAMRSEGVEHVTLDADGTVSVRRRVTVTGVFTL